MLETANVAFSHRAQEASLFKESQATKYRYIWSCHERMAEHRYDVLKALMMLAQDEDIQVRVELAKNLNKIFEYDPPEAMAFVGMLAVDRNKSVRKHIAGHLGWISKSAPDAAVLLASKFIHDVSVVALEVIKHRDELAEARPEATAIIIYALRRHSNADVRKAAERGCVTERAINEIKGLEGPAK